jgi:hypothetical protein
MKARNLFGLNVVLVLLGCMLAPAVVAQAGVVYQGSLSSDTGCLVGNGIWVYSSFCDPDELPDWRPAELSWTVSENADGSFHYSYTLEVFKGAVSHLIIEVSQTFTCADLLNAEGPFGETEVGWHEVQSGNPNMPEHIYGIKFDEAWGTTATFGFDAWRKPVWGDFYAKDGKAGGDWNFVHNAGFTVGDVDPGDDPSDGSVGCHILVPDSVILPEPATMGLLGLGLGAMVIGRKRSR